MIKIIPDSQLKDDITRIEISNLMERNQVVWKLNSSVKFTARSANKAFQGQGSKFRWSKVIWGGWVLYKHSFLHGKICTDVLHSHDRLRNKGIIHHSNCKL